MDENVCENQSPANLKHPVKRMIDRIKMICLKIVEWVLEIIGAIVNNLG